VCPQCINSYDHLRKIQDAKTEATGCYTDSTAHLSINHIGNRTSSAVRTWSVLFLYGIFVMKIVAYSDLGSVSSRYKVTIVVMRFELIYSRMQSRNAAHYKRKLCVMFVAKSALRSDA
jgi:hypothetical protein